MLLKKWYFYEKSVTVMVKRLTISLDKGLPANFDKFVAAREYSNRPEAIHNLTGKALDRGERDAGNGAMG